MRRPWDDLNHNNIYFAVAIEKAQSGNGDTLTVKMVGVEWSDNWLKIDLEGIHNPQTFMIFIVLLHLFLDFTEPHCLADQWYIT